MRIPGTQTVAAATEIPRIDLVGVEVLKVCESHFLQPMREILRIKEPNEGFASRFRARCQNIEAAVISAAEERARNGIIKYDPVPGAN